MATLLYLSSKDRSSGENYDFELTTQIDHTSNVDGFFVTILNVEFANTVYPINDYNRTIYLSENGGATKTVSIPAGFYEGSEFATAFQVALQASGTPFASTYFAALGTGAGQYILAIANTTVAANFSLLYGSNNAYDEMGFSVNQTGTVSSTAVVAMATTTNVIVGTWPINISGSNYVDIVSNFAGKSYSSSMTNNVICRIALNVGFGDIISRPPDYGYSFFSFNRDITRIRFQLKDDKTNFWELPDTSYFSIVIKIDNIASSINKKRLVFEDDNVVPVYRPTKYLRAANEAAYDFAESVKDYMPPIIQLSADESNNEILTGDSTGNRVSYAGSGVGQPNPVLMTRNNPFPTYLGMGQSMPQRRAQGKQRETAAPSTVKQINPGGSGTKGS